MVKLKSQRFASKYQAKFGNAFSYEFSQGDLERIQSLINELRETITASELFEDDHRIHQYENFDTWLEELIQKSQFEDEENPLQRPIDEITGLVSSYLFGAATKDHIQKGLPELKISTGLSM